MSSEPVKPPVMVTSTEPAPPLLVPATSVGAATDTGRTASGMRAEVPPLLQLRKPEANSASVALSVVSNVTSNEPVSPCARVRVVGVTVTSTPGGACTAAVQVPPCSAVTLRVTVASPASWPIWIDGMFSSSGVMAGNESVMSGSNRSSPWPL
jgi:hypothetical protein